MKLIKPLMTVVVSTVVVVSIYMTLANDAEASDVVSVAELSDRTVEPIPIPEPEPVVKKPVYSKTKCTMYAITKAVTFNSPAKAYSECRQPTVVVNDGQTNSF